MANRPNVVLIVCDDLGPGDVGRFGDGSSVTPALDELSREGVCLTSAYGGGPVCTPSRGALFSGCYSQRTGALDMRELRGLNRLSQRVSTIADSFRAGGYRTGMVGKWHLGTIGHGTHPLSRGFEEFVGFRGGMSDYYDWRLYDNWSMRESDGRYLTDVLTDEAIGYISRHRREQFFLHLAYNAPHTPPQADAEDVRPFAEQGIFSEAVSTIYGMIRRLDQNIERLMSRTRALGLEDNTIVVFTSDHGPQFGGSRLGLTDRYNCGFRGSKGTIYEGGIRVPSIVRWPAGLEGGRLVSAPVHHIDWMPTLLSAASLPNPSEMDLDGQDVWPVLRGERAHPDRKLFWQWNRYLPVMEYNAAMRMGRWKLVRPPVPEVFLVDPEDMRTDRIVERDPEAYFEVSTDPLPDRVLPEPPPVQLFDLESDPREQNDLAAQHPEVVSRMSRELEAWSRRMQEGRELAWQHV